MKILIRFPLHRLHILIVLSEDPDAKNSPSGENTMLVTQSECPVKVLMCSPLDNFHITIEQSSDPDAKTLH